MKREESFLLMDDKCDISRWPLRLLVEDANLLLQKYEVTNIEI
jgi:hypothetical protein